jgi:hypothetical protein
MTSLTRISNMTRIEQLLTDPAKDITLDELKDELNELALVRDKSRVQFCKRLAVAYMLLVGRALSKSEPKDGASGKFYAWCTKNIRSAGGKLYTTSTLRGYLQVGFSSNPEVALKQKRDQANHRSETMRKLGIQVDKAVKKEDAPKPIPITKLKEQYRLPTDVAREVNELMRAWENASSQARAQFIYVVTGKKIKVD